MKKRNYIGALSFVTVCVALSVAVALSMSYPHMTQFQFAREFWQLYAIMFISAIVFCASLEGKC